MKSRKNCWRQQWSWFGIILLITAGGRGRAQVPDLLKKATKVADFRSPNQGVPIVQHWWLSPTQLLINGRLEQHDSWEHLFRYDLTTRHSTRLDALAKLLDLSNAESLVFRRDEIRVSPDGQWILWTDDQHPPVVSGAHPDGSGLFRFLLPIPKR